MRVGSEKGFKPLNICSFPLFFFILYIIVKHSGGIKNKYFFDLFKQVVQIQDMSSSAGLV